MSEDKEIEAMRKENFEALVSSYSVELVEDSAERMAEMALRGMAKQWGGCISCVFSRRREQRQNEEAAMPGTSGFWTRRACVLGLSQDTCGEHLSFPEEEKEG